MILMLITYYYLKKSNNEYIIRYKNVNKMIIAPLQLKIKNSFFGVNYIYLQTIIE